VPEDGVFDPRQLFAPPVDEICWRSASVPASISRQAIAHPRVGLIGCEVFENGIVRLVG